MNIVTENRYPSDSDPRNGCRIIFRSAKKGRRYYVDLPSLTPSAIEAQAKAIGGSVPNACATLLGFVGLSQLAALLEACEGEEKAFFIDKLNELAAIIASMPLTYEQEGKRDDAIVYLHYFTAGTDWYILEKDMGCPTDGPEDFQTQAFGIIDRSRDFSDTAYCYINIPELLSVGAELDCYFEPRTLRELTTQCRAHAEE